MKIVNAAQFGSNLGFLLGNLLGVLHRLDALTIDREQEHSMRRFVEVGTLTLQIAVDVLGLVAQKCLSTLELDFVGFVFARLVTVAIVNAADGTNASINRISSKR